MSTDHLISAIAHPDYSEDLEPGEKEKPAKSLPRRGESRLQHVTIEAIPVPEAGKFRQSETTSASTLQLDKLYMSFATSHRKTLRFLAVRSIMIEASATKGDTDSDGTAISFQTYGTGIIQ